MPLTKDFKAANDQFHLKQRVISLEFLLYSCENVDLRLHTHLLTIVIYDHTEDVAQLQYKYVLLDEDLADFHQATLEKLVIVDEVACEHKLGLEGGPDRMGFLTATFLA